MTTSRHEWGQELYEEESDVSRPGTEFVKPGDPNFAVLIRDIKIQSEVDKRAYPGCDYDALRDQVAAEYDAAYQTVAIEVRTFEGEGGAELNLTVREIVQE